MAAVYAFSPGKEKDVALSSVRNELKEYIQTMSLVETELEQSMGTFLLQMQGIQGKIANDDALQMIWLIFKI